VTSTGLRRLRPAVALAAAGAGALTLAACGGSSQPADLAAGKQKFIQVCGGCHALENAGTKGGPPIAGVLMPNLDDAFRASREQGWKDSQFRGVVREWIKIAQEPMPKNLITGQDAENVAAYIASVAGTSPESSLRKLEPTTTEPIRPAGLPPPGGAEGGGGAKGGTGTTGTTPAGGGKAGGAAASRVTVDTASGTTLRFATSRIELSAGPGVMTLVNKGAIPHNLAVKGGGVHTGPTPTIGTGQTAQLKVDLKPGTYEYYCAVPGHEQAGMKGTLTVK
jgi:plastocyanin/mono/diheme cytochrome c family protein